MSDVKRRSAVLVASVTTEPRRNNMPREIEVKAEGMIFVYAGRRSGVCPAKDSH